MKRTAAPRKQRLKKASSVGWLAEFPVELWGLMIETLFPGEEKVKVPDLALMLTLMGACKMLAQLFKERVITLLREFFEFEKYKTCYQMEIRYLGDKEKTWRCVSTVLDDQLKTSHVDLKVYLRCCIDDAAFQTPAHLSNCVSLIRLASMEGRYLYKEHMDYTTQQSLALYTFKSLRPMSTRTKDAYRCLRDMKYFRLESKSALCLYRLKNVSVMEGYKYGTPSKYERTEPTSLFTRATEILTKKGDTLTLDMLNKHTQSYDGYTWIGLAVSVIAGAGELVETKKATAQHNFHSVIVTLNNRQHYIYSDDPVVVAFRKQCFKAMCTVDEAKQKYILNSLHTRNWESVLSTGRYTVA